MNSDDDDAVLEDGDNSVAGSIQFGLPEGDVLAFEKTEAQLEGFYEEIGLIAKKKPDDPLNKFKLNFINQMLEHANRLLGDRYRPFPDFAKFDADALPTASDVVTILSQYLRSMDKFRKDFTKYSFGEYNWTLSDSGAKIRAKRPKNFDK